MKINKQDTNGVKAILSTGELGYDNYPAGGDAGRVYVGNGAENIPQAKKTEVVAVDGKVDTHVARNDNPHNVTKTQVGLSNVDNTSDLNKPISTAMQNALDLKQHVLVSGTNVKTIENQSIIGTGNIDLTKTDVGLNNVDNTADSTKVVASAGKWTTSRLINGTAVDGTIDITTGQWGTSRNITIGSTAKSVNGSADISWSLAEIGAIGTASPAFTGVPTAPTAAVNTNTTQLATTAFVNAEIANDAIPRVTGINTAIPKFDGVSGAIQSSHILINSSDNFVLPKASGGSLTVSLVDGASNTNLVLPESGTVSSVGTTVTDNAITRYDGTTGKLQNSSVIIDDNGNIGIGGAPSAWATTTGRKALDVGSHGAVVGINGSVQLTENATFNGVSGSGWVYRDTVAASYYEQSSGNHIWKRAVAGASGNNITWLTSMDLTAANLTVGTGVVGNTIMSWYDASNLTFIRNYTIADATTIFECDIAGVRKSAILANGTFQSATNVYGSTSDIKLKENVVDATPKLDKLMQVKVKNFNYIGQEEKQIGVIAQEIETVFPGVVYETEDEVLTEVTKTREITLEDGTVATEEYLTEEMTKNGEVTKNVKYSVLYMMMLKGMQEQNEVIKDLKARVAELENK